jgi:hypothetical protein
MNACGHSNAQDVLPIGVAEWRKQTESHDSRLFVIESSLREVLDGMRVWSTIVKDGMADLSMQMTTTMAQKSRLVQTRHLDAAIEKSCAVSDHVFKVGQQTQVIPPKVGEDPDVDARLSKIEGRLQELQSAIQELQSRTPKEVLSSLCEVVQVLHELNRTWCSRIEQKPNIGSESCQQPWSRSHPDEQQQQRVQVHETSQPRSQVQRTSWLNATVPLAQKQTTTNHVKQHSGLATQTPPLRENSTPLTWRGFSTPLQGGLVRQWSRRLLHGPLLSKRVTSITLPVPSPSDKVSPK